MYLYLFDRYAGIDRVFVYKGNNSFRQGEIIECKPTLYALVLGNHPAFIERYSVRYEELLLNDKGNRNNEQTLQYKTIFRLQDTTMYMIHRMVEYRYTTYKKVIPLFLTNSLIAYLRLFHKTVSKKKDGQRLIIYPDLWTMVMQSPKSYLDGTNPSIVALHSKLTDRQVLVIKEKIRQGKVTIVCTTSAEIFHDWNNLQEITIVDPYKRYYRNQQDPRYKVKRIVEEMRSQQGYNLSSFENYKTSSRNPFVF